MIKRLGLATFIAVSLVFSHSGFADVFYVALDGSNTAPYDTWVKAATDPQVAIDLAADTPGGQHQVWVKEGVYKPQFNPHTETAIPREWCFALRNNVEVYGGFAGWETLLSQRDYLTNQTILSGDRGTADTWVNGTPIVSGTVFNPPPTGDPSQDLPVGNNSTNCYHVIYNLDQDPDINSTAVLDGFITIGGNADLPPNSHGGGMYNNNALPNVNNCIFSGNSAYNNGGGMYGSASLTNCSFIGNSAGGQDFFHGGGGIYTSSGLALSECIISGNTTVAYGGGIMGGSFTSTNCTISNNYASVAGGGVCTTGSPTLTGCTFVGNSASYGGGMETWYASPKITNCTFSNNDILNELGSSLTLTNCTFSSSGPMVRDDLGSTVATNCIFWGDDEYGLNFSSNSNVRYSIINGDISGFGEGCLNTNPNLGSFGNHGGVTDCYSIPSDSVAVNAGVNVYKVTSDVDTIIYLSRISGEYRKVSDDTVYNTTGQTLVMLNLHDQRDLWRTIPVDIGSYEYGALPYPTPTPTPTLPVSAPPWIYDYNGDGTSDIAIFRGTSGLWAVRDVTRVHFGSTVDTVVPGDYNGDGTTNIAIFRDNSGLWAIRRFTRIYYGRVGDEPISGDYDGDGTWDIGIWRHSTGLLSIMGIGTTWFGQQGDILASGDYDGDRTIDLAIFRPSTGLWAISDMTRIYFGSTSDIIVPGDYDGDGDWDAAIFRPASGLWAIRGLTRRYFGASTDWKAPADYDGNATDDIGIFRDSSGLWAVRGISRVYFGTSGDVPVTR